MQEPQLSLQQAPDATSPKTLLLKSLRVYIRKTFEIGLEKIDSGTRTTGRDYVLRAN